MALADRPSERVLFVACFAWLETSEIPRTPRTRKKHLGVAKSYLLELTVAQALLGKTIPFVDEDIFWKGLEAPTSYTSSFLWVKLKSMVWNFLALLGGFSRPSSV